MQLIEEGGWSIDLEHWQSLLPVYVLPSNKLPVCSAARGSCSGWDGRLGGGWAYMSCTWFAASLQADSASGAGLG